MKKNGRTPEEVASDEFLKRKAIGDDKMKKLLERGANQARPEPGEENREETDNRRKKKRR